MTTNNTYYQLAGETISPLHLAIAERRGVAHVHDDAMEVKYGWSPDGYPNWHDDEGRHHDYPLPYSPRFFYRFVDLFFRHGAESGMIDTLEQNFIGNEADAWYIEELLTKAESFGLFTPGAAVILYANPDTAFIETWEPGQTVNSRWAHSYNTYYGSKANRARRKQIRKWLKLKSKEPVPFSSVLQNQTAAEAETSILPFLIGDKSIKRCDAAALRIGLTVGNVSIPKAKPRQIDALAYALVDSHRANGNELAFRIALAKRYGVDYSKGYDRNHSFDGSRTNTKWAADAANARDEASKWVPTPNSK